MAKQNGLPAEQVLWQAGSLNRKFDLMIERLDVIAELMGSVDKTLQRHEGLLTKHGERLIAIEGTLKEIRSDLLEKAVHYGDWVLLHTETGTTRAGILRE